MSLLHVVRHGQASFMAEDYDQLSEIGEQQGRTLGDSWLKEQVEIDEVYVGTLNRQRQTAEALGQRFREAGQSWPEPRVLAGLNEYAADQIMTTLRSELSTKHAHVQMLSQALDDAQSKADHYRCFHRLLETLMTYYVAGDYESVGFETWQQFHDRVTDAFAEIRSSGSTPGRRVAVFTSGGPVGVCVQTALEAPEQQATALHWRVYNASVTRFVFTRDRVSLDQFNSVAHLPPALRTYR